MSKVYVVMGATGEYSDHSEWPCAAYMNEDIAKEHVVRATEAANAFVAQNERYGVGYHDALAAFQKSNALDPYFSTDYSGFNYYITDVELLDAVPSGTATENPPTQDDAMTDRTTSREARSPEVETGGVG